ncbi:hypothetical protein NLU14_21470, partial [Marinobacter sp. 71-i]
ESASVENTDGPAGSGTLFGGLERIFVAGVSVGSDEILRAGLPVVGRSVLGLRMGESDWQPRRDGFSQVNLSRPLHSVRTFCESSVSI